jgi:hypothetical protein
MLLLDLTIRNAQADVVGTAAINGTLVIKSGQGQTLVTIPLGATPFLPAVDGVAGLAGPVAAVAVLSGTASYFELYRSDVSLILRGTVGVAAGDLLLTDTVVVVGDTVSVDALSYVAPEA